jgi:selenocysteine lyase/cysteine desulfurase
VEHALALAERITGSDMSVVQHVDPNTGAVNPVGGGAVALDATLSAGAIPLDAGALGADFIAIAGDRWLMGPEETAALWIGPRWADRAHVPAASGLGRTALLGLARSVGWLEMYVGLEWAYSRTATLVRRLLGSVSSIPRVSVATPAESPAAMVCFAVERWPVEEVLDELRRRVFAIVGSTPDGQRVRASVGWWNTEDEIDRFCGAVTEIAQNTPDSIPRRLPLLGQS